LYLRRRRLQTMVAHVDRFVSPSRHLRERVLRAYGLAPERVLWSPHGLDSSKFAPRDPRPGRLRFGYVGAVDFHKGGHVLLDAFARGVSADLVLVGRVTERFAPLLRSRVWPGVEVRSPVTVADRARIYADFDVLVMPSVCRENWPLAIQEAFLAGLPVVGSNIGGIAELLAQGGGLLVPPGDASALHRALCALAGSPARVAALRRQIPAVRHLDEQAAEIRGLYEELCGRP
jgi:glycosyltransferase involved in cell wall biosynthesis